MFFWAVLVMKLLARPSRSQFAVALLLVRREMSRLGQESVGSVSSLSLCFWLFLSLLLSKIPVGVLKYNPIFYIVTIVSLYIIIGNTIPNKSWVQRTQLLWTGTTGTGALTTLFNSGGLLEFTLEEPASENSPNEHSLCSPMLHTHRVLLPCLSSCACLIGLFPTSSHDFTADLCMFKHVFQVPSSSFSEQPQYKINRMTAPITFCVT